MIAPDFKPSEVVLTAAFPPLVGTMGKTELECTAAIVVRALVLAGDTWGPVAFKEISNAIETDLAAKTQPIHGIVTNPFLRPAFQELGSSRFARWSNPGTLDNALEFTAEGIEAMRRWVRRAA